MKNCGLTQIIGTIRDAAGNPLNGQRVRIQWPSGSAISHESGTPGEYDPGAYDVVLDDYAKDGNWHVWVVDGAEQRISNDLFVQTTASCESDGAANVVEVNFRRNS